MTFFTFSLGCKVNSYESASLAAILLSKGYIEDKNNPDIVIINTCSVTHVADRKSRQHIRKFRKDFPNAVIAVMGCFAQGAKDEVIKECDADIVVGTSNRAILIDLIEQFLLDHKRICKVDIDPRKYIYEELGITSYSENVRAYLKIQDGCNNFCTYCLIPYRRGVSRSRNFNDIILEAKELVRLGYKEIIITGIHIGLYGKDIGTNFSSLVKALLEIDGLFRLRISSLEESEIDDELIDMLINNDKLAKHLHIPLQSGSDTVLKRMNRKYNCEQFYNKLTYIRNRLPDVCLTTDVIVGFPGETDEEFLQTYNFIKKVGFNELHVFPYSRRSGTAADLMKDQVDEKVKKCRSNKLLELSDSLWNQYKMINEGKEVKVLIEKVFEDNTVGIGHTSNYLEVKINSTNLNVADIVTTTYKKD